MNISCAICGDIFTGLNPDETVYTTVCGHLFHYNCLIEWFERSKTCPQCRHKTTEKNITRIFFNNTNITGADADPTLLKYRVESLELQLMLSQKDVKTLTEEKNIAVKQNKGLRKEIKDMNTKVICSEQKLYTVTDELKSLKSYCKQLSEVKLENEILKNELISCKSLNAVINGSVDEAKRAAENLDAEYLQICVKHFKERVKKLESEYKNSEKETLFYRKEAARFKDMLNKLKQKNSSSKMSDRSIIEISDDEGSGLLRCSNSSSIKENLNNDSIVSSCENPSKNSISPSTEPLFSFTKLNPTYQSKSVSLIGVTQMKSHFKIPKTKSSLSADGDDKYIPTKYNNVGKITKKCKKQLSSSAVSSIQKFVNDKEKKISEHFGIL